MVVKGLQLGGYCVVFGSIFTLGHLSALFQIFAESTK